MIAAPFLGEFGWQVALWVPWLRWVRTELYASRDFQVICKPGHEGLYEDFATSITTHEVKGITKHDCELAWIDGVQVKKPAYESIVRAALEEPKKRIQPIICPTDMNYTWPPGRPPLPIKAQVKYHKYGSSKRDDKLVALHARHCPDKQPERDWEKGNWSRLSEALLGEGYSLCSVGSKGGAKHVHGTEDMRGLSIKEEVEILSACQYIIGPSSGPLHLANHCGTPAAWWADGSKNLERYDKAWNPFGVKNICVSFEDWQPSVGWVIACLNQS